MMPLNIESTLKTPEVNFNPTTGDFSIKGMSCVEHALDFYKPIFQWLDVYKENPSQKTTLNIQFKYFNTSSAKCILQMLERIAVLPEKSTQLEVNWFYDVSDEQMLEDGENYSEILGIPFNLVEKV